MVQIALAPCSPFSVTTSLMRATAELAEKLDVRLHTHLAETEDENKFCEQIHGCRPLDYLEECGWLNARTWLAHGIHFNAGRDEAARQGQDHHQPLRLQQPDSGVRLLPGLRDGGGGGGHRPRRRWLGLERRIQPDAGGARRVPVAARALRRRPRSATRTRCAGRPRARRPASAARSWARSPSAKPPIWRCSSSMNCASPVMAIRWPRWCCAARIAPTG